MGTRLVAVVLSLFFVAASCQLLPFEPVQYMRAQLAKPETTSFSSVVKEAGPSQAADYMSRAKALLKSHLKGSETNAFLLRGEKVLVQHKTNDFKWGTGINLPYTNTISLVGVVLPILLEGFKTTIIKDPIGKVLKGEDLQHPLISGREDKSFLDLMNKLPRKSSKVDLESAALLNELGVNGELVLHFANAVLGKSANEAWKDAMMGVGTMDAVVDPKSQVVVDVSALLQISLTISHDLRNIAGATKKERIPLDADKYLFGWWFNCVKDCLIPAAPRDVVFSLSKNIRIYTSPSLDLTLMIFTEKSYGSIADILLDDGEIWRVLVEAAEPQESQQHSEAKTKPEVKSKEEVKTAKKEPESAPTEQPSMEPGDKPTESQKNQQHGEANNKPEVRDTRSSKEEAAKKESTSTEQPSLEAEDKLAELIHWIWPILVFLFWVTFSHVWVYWMLHIFWLFFTSISKRAHIPRPKTATEKRN